MYHSVVDNYMEHLYQKHQAKFNIDSISSEKELSDWQADLRKEYAACLGAMPNSSLLDVVISEDKYFEREGFRRLKIEYTFDDALRAPAYVLVPDKPNGAGVIALHGHGYGVRDIVGVRASGEEREIDEDPGYHKDFALELVKRGFVVAAPELFGFGELMLAPNPRHMHGGAGSSCFSLTTQLLLYGKTMAGMRVWQGVRMLEYLMTRDDVDAERIGAMGISGGGLAASFLAAYEQRVKACVVSGYLCTYKDSIMSVHHCVDNFPPGLLNCGEMADLFGLIAPRPILIESGTRDDIFPIDGVKSSYDRIESLYKRIGADGKTDIDIFEGGHQISGAKAYDFLLKQL